VEIRIIGSTKIGNTKMEKHKLDCNSHPKRDYLKNRKVFGERGPGRSRIAQEPEDMVFKNNHRAFSTRSS
jgi:hypothetical protein